MNRREFVGLVGAAVASPSLVYAQTGNAPLVGFLNSGSSAGRDRYVSAFQRGLEDVGFFDGKNVTIQYRWAEDQLSRLPILAAELISKEVSVIAAIGTAAPGVAAKAQTSSIPIVFQTGGDPVKDGLVEALGKPERNITGVMIFSTAIEEKRLGILHELKPGAGPIGVLIYTSSPAAVTQLNDIKMASQQLGRTIQIYAVAGEEEIEDAFHKLDKDRPESLLVSSGPFFYSRRDQIIIHAARMGIPTLYERREFVEGGGLMSYGPRFSDAYRLTGYYVVRVLRGEKPAELPVLQTTSLELAFNLRTARAMNLTLPPYLLARADEVIE